jgi:FtsP/CotA-like multicopper oxidase with cupredoxin domain
VLGAGAVSSGATQTPGSGQGGGQGPRPAPPAVGNVPDPRTLPVEDWSEPWVWRPSEWPGQPLALHLVGNAHAPRSTVAGNRFTPLFSYNGSSPAPTIRTRGDETLRITLRNTLGPNTSQVPVGAAPDLLELVPDKLKAATCAMLTGEGRPCTDAPDGRLLFTHNYHLFSQIPVPLVDTTCLSTPATGPHGSHTTNLHTHGLHVEPGANANGTEGDNTFLRILPRGDWEARQRSGNPACQQLGPHDRVAEATFEYKLGRVASAALTRGGGAEAHPPGTHWYHPHSHGATHDQVASGLAGFLIVEGDVDDAINLAMTGVDRPDATIKTGPYDYRERLMLLQRVEVQSVDVDAGPRRNQGRQAPPTAINGGFIPTSMFMRPGAIERWRVINGSVDGRGAKSFMVLEGQFVFEGGQLWKVLPPEDAGTPRRIEPASRQDVTNATRQIYQLAFDGITLVSVENGRTRYSIKDLSQQNAGSQSPLDRPAPSGVAPDAAALANVEDCYRDGESLRNLHRRPNQVFLTNANRADVFFKAPVDAAGKIFTVFAQESVLQTDNLQQRLQMGVASGRSGFSAGNPAPIDVVVGWVRVSGEPVPGGDFDVMTLRERLPDVPPALRPVENDELRVPAAEAARRRVPTGSFRSRVLSYSGYGTTDFPLIEVPAGFADSHPGLKGRLWDEVAGTRVLLPPFARTMAINGRFDLAADPNPPTPQKFSHHGTDHPRALVATAEEWVVYNCSVALWSHTNTQRFVQPGHYGGHYRAYPMSRVDGQTRFAVDPEFRITTKGADHPFHIHVNPCWVTRIDAPDEHGRLHNLLDEPRWMDTIAIPRGGRVVFRSRFLDYVGQWVNHCHILMHEDHGMMQAVAAVASAEDANYNPRAEVASHTMSSDDVSRLYPRPSLQLMYRQNMSFVDSHPELGQTFPGFELEVPRI